MLYQLTFKGEFNVVANSVEQAIEEFKESLKPLEANNSLGIDNVHVEEAIIYEG